MTPLVIIGAGGHGRELLDIALAVNDRRPTFDILGFLDDGPPGAVAPVAPVLGPVSDLATLDAEYAIGIGSEEARCRIDSLATGWGRRAATLLHPTATVGVASVLAPGVVMAAGSRVTTNVHLGRHTHLNVNATVSHDGRIGSYVTISPGATLCGSSTVRDGVLVGAGATLVQGAEVGPWSVVGAGAVVLRSVAAETTVVGVPARVLSR